MKQIWSDIALGLRNKLIGFLGGRIASGSYFNIAKENIELEKIYRFRYCFYYGYYGRIVEGIDNKNKKLVDAFDNKKNTIQIYLGDIDNIKAVIRCIVWNKGNMPDAYKKSFGLDIFPWINDITVVELGRFVSNRSLKNKFVILRLIFSVLKYLEDKHEASMIIASCKPGLVSHYRLMGLQNYNNKLISYPDGIEIPIAGIIDKKHTVKTISKRVFSYKNNVPKNAYDSLFSEPTSTIHDAEEIINILLETEFCNDTTIFNILEKLVGIGAYAMRLNQPIKIVQKNSRENVLYFLLEGNASIKYSTTMSYPLRRGFIIGGSSFLLAEKRRAYDVHVENAKLLVITHGVYKRFSKYSPALASELKKIIAKQVEEQFKFLYSLSS